MDALEAYLETRGIDITDDCGRDGVEPTAFRNGELAAATTDALQLFLNEIRRYPLLTRRARRSSWPSGSSRATSRPRSA